jgi:uncharacterized protein (TIGR02271 family)
MMERDETPTGGLARLDERHDLDVAEGDADPRGWDVVSAEGHKVGQVKDLIVDATALRVRYLEVELEGAARPADERQQRVLVPIGDAHLRDDVDQVTLPTLRSADLVGLPTYEHGAPITRDYETSLGQRLDAARPPVTPSADTASDDFYASERFDENRFRRAPLRGDADPDEARDEERLVLSEERLDIGTRREQRGMVELRKRVETEHVREEVPLRREDVTVERRPLGADAPPAEPMGDSEIRIPLMAEEVVVEKRVVPTEELVIRKRVVQGEQTVEADVRRERVDVDDTTNRGAPDRAARPPRDDLERPNP